MADFQQNSQQKSAARILAIPIADVDAFHAIVQDIIMNNPFGCISYHTPGTNHPPIEKVREMYTAKFVYTDSGGKRVGSGSEVYNSIAGFNAGIAAVTSHIANVAAHGGTVSRNPAAPPTAFF